MYKGRVFRKLTVNPPVQLMYTNKNISFSTLLLSVIAHQNMKIPDIYTYVSKYDRLLQFHLYMKAVGSLGSRIWALGWETQ
jgi:hypothetical protein